MAFNSKKVLVYGAAGVILALVVVMFIPAYEKIQINPYVTFDQIPGYGFQIVKVSEKEISLTHLDITIHRIDVQLLGGEWTPILEIESTWDLIQERQKSFDIQLSGLETGTYSKVRLFIAVDPEKTSATYSNNRELSVSVMMNPIEVEVSEFVVSDGTSEAVLTLYSGPGISSNHVFPDYQIEISSSKLSGEVS
jgi:hypothetical protein